MLERLASGNLEQVLGVWIVDSESLKICFFCKLISDTLISLDVQVKGGAYDYYEIWWQFTT